ncbi:MAG: hypothetical protein EXS35_09560 [Pedosphaera sp.]|nr:hypothetical protein [Pedosphaera sp.]
MLSHSLRCLLVLAALWSPLLTLPAAPSWKAGTAKTIITPAQPIWLAGYAGRNKPADGKVTELWLKVLALEDADGHRAVILTSDTLGIPQTIYRNTCAALKDKFGLAPEQIIFSASHTHCGPILRGALYDIYPLNDQQRGVIEEYSAQFEKQIVATVGKAIADLAPARLASGQGETKFAVNRRNNPEGGVPKLIEQGALKGPVDHAVPVLAVFLPDGKLKTVLFGYACHNTTMNFNQYSGDYAGFAQMALEHNHTNATAMFFMGCGGDQNPLPRRQPELAERYGQMLASAVEEVLLAPAQTLPPKLVTKMEMIPLHLGAEPTEAELIAMKAGTNVTNKRWATRLLGDLKAGKQFIREYPFPLQAWKLGDKQLLLTLGGEPVVDYALKFKKEFGADTWVAGYCNDVMTYIPSLRVLREDIPPLAEKRWGYEGHQAMLVYGLPAQRWAENVEDLITDGARRLVKEVKARK